MNARDIEVFCEIMRGNSLSLAAKALGVSQPAMSQALRHCEDRVGFALFRRHAGRLTPTAEATALWPEAERLFHELHSFRSLTRDLGGRQGGLLRLGTTSSLGVSLVPKAVAQLRREWPLARISVNLMPVRELGEALLAHAYIDFATAERGVFKLMFSQTRTHGRSPELLQKGKETFGVLLSQLAHREGGAPNDPPIRTRGLRLWTFVHGLSFLLIDDKVSAMEIPLDLSEMVADATRRFLQDW